MEKNVGKKDRQYRYIGALVFLVAWFFFKSVWLLVIGFILFITAYFEFCAAYKLLKKNTMGQVVAPSKSTNAKKKKL